MRLLIGAIVMAIVGAAMAGWLIARTSAPPSGPVILISIDALRADHLGAYGYRRAPTPNIDALAADGIVFERAYSHSPLTVPAHASILSGRLPFETGARFDDRLSLAPKLPMLPALLHRRGFKTAGIVSSALLGRSTGLAGAFDFYDDEMPQRTAAVPAAAVRREAAATMEVAKRWIDQQGTRFFLFLHLDEPRAPHAPPAPASARTPYDAAIVRADAQVGRLMQFLKERDLYDRAIIVLLSDHGASLGEHGEAEHGLFLYEATSRTPLVVKLPKNEGGGRRRSEVVQHVDVAPTILDLMGAPRPSGLRGRSLRHLLTSEDATLSPTPVYAESLYARLHFGWGELQSITDGRYRFIRAPRPELYDLMQDRGERENLAESNALKVTELSAMLDKLTAGQPPAAPSRLSEEDRQALLLLGAERGSAASVGRSAGTAAIPPTASGAGDVAGATQTAPGAMPPSGAGQAPPAPGVGQASRLPDDPLPADPKDRLPLLDKLRAADSQAAAGRFNDAILAYRDIVAADPGMRDAWLQLGAALAAAGQWKESLEAYRQVVRLDPEEPAGVMGTVRALLRLARLDDAVQYAVIASRLEPVTGGELLARVELRRRNYAAARQAADAVRQADPSSPLPAFVEGMELYQSGKYEEALPRLEEAVRQSSSRPVQVPDVRFYAGDALARLRRYTDAEVLLADELKWFPESVKAREALASVFHATGRTEDLPALVTDLVRGAPTPEAYAAACRITLLSGDRKGATSLRAEARQLFGEPALRAAELAPRQ